MQLDQFLTRFSNEIDASVNLKLIFINQAKRRTLFTIF